MMLSLRELRRAVRLIEARISDATLRKITQPEAHQLILKFEGSSGKSHVMISTKPGFARICITDKVLPQARPPFSFCEYLRAHLTGTRLSRMETPEDDRQIRFHLDSRSEHYVLIFSILGSRSNVYLLKEGEKLVHAMRSLDETRRELKIGEVWINPRGRVPSSGIDRWEEVADDRYLEVIDQLYRDLERRNKAAQLVSRIENALKKERTFLGRKSINLREDLAEAKLAEEYREKGELLKSVLHEVRPGDAGITAVDQRTGKTVEIPLDSKISPAANLESYFARYHRESRAVPMIQQQLLNLQFSLCELETIERQLREASKAESADIEALESMMRKPAIRRLINRHLPARKTAAPSGRKKDKKGIPARLMPKRYRTQDGLEIWVGRSDESNDYLTTRLARGNDLFFHLEVHSGSHVILRTEGRSDPPQESLLDACELAVHFSSLKNSRSADVRMAPVKEVKKPKGAKPGLVYVRKSKTIHLRRESKRLENILASRLDN